MTLQLAGVRAPQARFISVMGSLTANSAYNPFEVVHMLARRTGGQGFSCLFRSSPILRKIEKC